MPFWSFLKRAPAPVMPQPRRAFVVPTDLGLVSDTGIPQYQPSLTARYVVANANGYVDYSEVGTVFVHLSYGDTKASISAKFEAQIRTQLGDPALVVEFLA